MRQHRTAYDRPVDTAGPHLNGASYGGGGAGERTDPPIKTPIKTPDERCAEGKRLRALQGIKE